MEHEPIRVGQVRETPNGTPYVILSPGRQDQTWWVKGRSGTATWRSCTIHDDPVVGWSREHLPPPVLTANPAEVVEGEVRACSDYIYYPTLPDEEGRFYLRYSDCGRGVVRHVPSDIAADRLVSRPGVTL